MNRTLSRTLSGTATNFTYDAASQSVTSQTIGGGATTYYAQGQQGPLAQQQSGTTLFYQQDTHGDLAALTNSSGTVTGTISYDPWGTPTTVGTPAQQSLLGYQSQPLDPTTHLTDMGARQYDPTQGRFTTQDSVFGAATSPLSLNQYIYATDSPLDYTDPTGMYIQCDNCTAKEQRAAREYSSAAIQTLETAVSYAVPQPRIAVDRPLPAVRVSVGGWTLIGEPTLSYHTHGDPAAEFGFNVGTGERSFVSDAGFAALGLKSNGAVIGDIKTSESVLQGDGWNVDVEAGAHILGRTEDRSVYSSIALTAPNGDSVKYDTKYHFSYQPGPRMTAREAETSAEVAVVVVGVACAAVEPCGLAVGGVVAGEGALVGAFG